MKDLAVVKPVKMNFALSSNFTLQPLKLWLENSLAIYCILCGGNLQFVRKEQ